MDQRANVFCVFEVAILVHVQLNRIVSPAGYSDRLCSVTCWIIDWACSCERGGDPSVVSASSRSATLMRPLSGVLENDCNNVIIQVAADVPGAVRRTRKARRT